MKLPDLIVSRLRNHLRHNPKASSVTALNLHGLIKAAAILFTKCSHFFGLKRIQADRIELRGIEITGVFCQSAIDSRVKN